MHCETLNIENTGIPGEAARRRLLSVWGEPLFLADWLRALFIHYEVPAGALQREVPFELDLREGKAYVSLVAFTMRGMRPFRGGWATAWMLKPIATNGFLNVRTYVRQRGEPGIYFLKEWMNNPLSVRLGPWTFGLPYHFGELDYRHQQEEGTFSGTVREKKGEARFRYEAEPIEKGLAPCPAASLDAFLLERYTAFTAHKTARRFFRIWHPAWEQQAMRISVVEDELMRRSWGWFREAKLVGGNYSPGARDVWMGRPHRIG